MAPFWGLLDTMIEGVSERILEAARVEIARRDAEASGARESVVNARDKAVLDAMADRDELPDGYLEACSADGHCWSVPAKAELARRKAAEP